MSCARSLRLAVIAALAALLGFLGPLALPAPALAGDPPCVSVYPSAGPAGVDLQGACVANDLVRNYTSPAGSPTDALWTLVLVLGASWAAAVIVYAIWRYLAGRAARRLAPVTPTAFWLCDGCRSFNGTEAMTCYRCRRRRAEDAPIVDASETARWEQRFGRPFGS